MSLISKFFSPRDTGPSRLARFLAEETAPLGTLSNLGCDLGALIEAEQDHKTLADAQERARETGDLKWAIDASKRLYDLGGKPTDGLEYLRNLIWARQFAAAEALFRKLGKDLDGTTSYDHAGFMLELGLGRFDNARGRLNRLCAEMPERSAEFHADYANRLIATGQFDDAEAFVADALERHDRAAALLLADVQLCLVSDGVAAALARLQSLTGKIPVASPAYRTTYAGLLLERGRYNEAYDLLAGWIEEDRKVLAYYPLAQMAAGHCDRTSEFIALVDDTMTRHPRLEALADLRCNLAIDSNDWDLADRLLPVIRKRNYFAYCTTQLARALQEAGGRDPQQEFDRLVAEGIRFPGPSIMLALFYYYYKAADDGIARARAAIAPFLADSQTDTGLLALNLRLMIAEGRDGEARAAYDALPKGLASTAPLGPFRMYFDARAGRDDAAEAGWKTYLEETAPMALNARSSYPETIRLRYKDRPGAVLLFLTVFNGAEFVDWFLDYYRALGVDHFFIVDNGSTDGTFERLLVEEDVSLFRNTESFSASACGVFWANHLMRKYGVGHWCFHVDMDEAFVFPKMDEGRSLRDFLAYLDTRGFGTVPAMMLDIYPESLEGNDRANPFEASRFIDRDYTFIRNELPPYTFVQGGLRARMSGRSLMMTKAPLVKMTPDTAYIANNHQHTHLAVADVSAALLHYKFIGDFIGRVDEAIERKEHFMGARFYVALRGAVSDSPDAPAARRLTSGHSVPYEGPAQLIELGLIHSGTTWG